MGLGLLQQALRFKIAQHRGAAFVAVHPGVRTGGGVHPPALVHHRDLVEAVSLADRKIVEIVGRRNLDRTGAEGLVDRGVGDDWDDSRGQRKAQRLAGDAFEAGVIGIHRDRRITQHRLGPRGRHRNEVSGAGVPARHRLERIADEVELPVNVLVRDFEVGKRGFAARAPVNQRPLAVNQTLLMEPDEDFDHRPRQALIQGEALAAPVAGGAQPAQLMENLAAVALAPFPDAALKGLAPELMAIGLLLGDFALHHVLRGDSGMVGAGHPQRVVALHPAGAHDDVLQGYVEGMSQMELAGDVGRRNHDREDRSGAGRVGFEIAQLHPALVPALLGDLGVKCFAQFQIKSVHREKLAAGRAALFGNHIEMEAADSTRPRREGRCWCWSARSWNLCAVG